MPDKKKSKTVSGRLPPDVHADFEEFRKEREISKSDAVRRLVESGLSESEEQEQLKKQAAEWRQRWRDEMEMLGGLALISASVFTICFLLFTGAYYLFQPGDLLLATLSILIVISLFVFVVTTIPAVAIYLILKSSFMQSVESPDVSFETEDAQV